MILLNGFQQMHYCVLFEISLSIYYIYDVENKNIGAHTSTELISQEIIRFYGLIESLYFIYYENAKITSQCLIIWQFYQSSNDRVQH